MRSVVGALLVLVGSCGGTRSDADAGRDGAGDVSADLGVPDDAGFTSCSTPENYRICGDNTSCPVGDSACTMCISVQGPKDHDVALCGETFVALFNRSCDKYCDDGQICLRPGGGLSLSCMPYSLGPLFSKYTTDPDRIRYADLGKWTGDPLPRPATCPSDADFRVCGGNCGGCLAGEICTGRSPLHPYGFCLNAASVQSCAVGNAKWCQAGTEGCFVFKVQPEAQPLADTYGICLALAECNALATRLPGGGTCIPK